MYFIQHIESISHQDSFQKENIWNELKPVSEAGELISPDYKNYIPAAALRRLSTILRMGITASKACQEKVSREFDSISVGTALGCLTDTEKFLVTINTVSGDILSPTAFIQSTHNTISGQISLDLKNHAYNMTHTQNALSFEVALKDGLLCVDEGKQAVLVGAADEAIPFLERVRPFMHTDLPFTSGATFLVVSAEQGNSIAHIAACEVSFSAELIREHIIRFLADQGISADEVDLVLEARSDLKDLAKKHQTFTEFTGFYQSASSFAVHLANDWFLNHPEDRNVLIVNNLESGKLGLTLVKRNGA